MKARVNYNSKTSLMSLPDSNPYVPDWENKNKCHDWKNYVSADVKRLWPQLTDEQKVAIAANFQQIADQEDWD